MPAARARLARPFQRAPASSAYVRVGFEYFDESLDIIGL